jgi:hypothetical protein
MSRLNPADIKNISLERSKYTLYGKLVQFLTSLRKKMLNFSLLKEVVTTLEKAHKVYPLIFEHSWQEEKHTIKPSFKTQTGTQ